MCANQENSWIGAGEIDELQIFLDPTLLSEAAAEVSDRRVDLLEGIGIRDPVVSAVATRLVEELSTPSRCSTLVGDSMAYALVAQLLSRHSNLRAASAVARIDMPAHKVRQAIDYIEAHLCDELSIDAIAAALAMSSFRFARGFKSGTGRSPHQYLIGRRIECAKDLLRSTERKLADIARAVGFSSQSHFTVVFGKQCGMTPLAFRNATRGR
jgi:AraC family transcriptional regulator